MEQGREGPRNRCGGGRSLGPRDRCGVEVGVMEPRNQESELETAVTQESMLDAPKVGKRIILPVIGCML